MIRPRPLHAVLGVGAGIALAGGSYAVAASAGNQIHACVNTRTHVLSLEAKCPRGSRAVVWSVRGPAGRPGKNGKNGKNGRNGTNGTNGISGTSVTLNPSVNVTEVSPSAPASASITQGGGGQDTLNLSIPQGAPGSTGPAGANTGPNAYGEVWVGSSTAELAPGSGVGVQTVTGGTGSAFVKVTNCTAATPTEPIITVTPNSDDADQLTGSNDNSTGEPTAYVNSFGNDNLPGDHVLTFTVLLTSTTGAAITSDFAFTVSC